ncbi:MAG: hypothetical protein ACP5KW_07920 [Thermoproteota archaeon]
MNVKDDGSSSFKSGLTWRSVLAILFSSLVLLPINLYLSLVAGVGIAGAAVYLTAILFSEVTLIFGSKLTEQELYVIYMMAGIAAGSPVFISWVYRQYYATSFITYSFVDPFTKKPIPEVLPSWWVPKNLNPEVRSFVSLPWLIPMFIAILQYGVFWIVQEVALTMISAQIFLEEENLPFPFATVNAQLISTLAERPRDKMYVFSTSAMVSMIIGSIMYGIPTLASGLFNVQLQFIPFPWIDFTTGYYGIEKILPGAMFGIATDPLSFLGAMLLPLDLLAYMLIGSVAVWIFGNWFFLNISRSIFPEWVSEWKPGMSLQLIWQRSILRVWTFPQIGFMLALAISTFFTGYKSFMRAFRSLTRRKESSRGAYFYSFKMLMLMYVGATLASIILFQYLVPDFPFWLTIIWIFGIGFLSTIAAVRARGEAMASVSIPYMWQSAVLISGYPKIDAWLISPVIPGSSAPTWVEAIKTAKLTKTDPRDFFKAYYITVILYHIFSFVYVLFLWQIAPIPSSVYPYTLISWPIQAIQDSMWYTRQILGKPTVLIFSFILMFVVGTLGTLASQYAKIPFSFVGLVTGTVTIPPYAISGFIGGLLSKYVLERIFGKERWNNYKAVVIAGFAAGEGLIVGIAAGIIFLSKAAWALPF